MIVVWAIAFLVILIADYTAVKLLGLDAVKALSFLVPAVVVCLKQYICMQVGKKKADAGVIGLLIGEFAKMIFVVAGLFLFVSPTSNENAPYSIAYCANFFVALIVEYIAFSKERQ
ncbi:MAG: hypothetical protein HUJ96_01675 [Marinilabiliaceae bacterium]|nr:hypothetical protein [Marinilabiliaceae bacterium]